MVVVIDSSVPRRVARFQPVWRKCMTTTIRLVRTIVPIGLYETNTIGLYHHSYASRLKLSLHENYHIPADFVVNQRPSENESDSNRDLLGLGDVSTTFFPCIRSK